MLDHVLRDGFHQRVIGHGLDENRAVVVLGRGGDVHLQGEGAPFLLQAVVDVFDGFDSVWGSRCGVSNHQLSRLLLVGVAPT
jgi:hypothetical protein